jgi:hypothetical protein
VRLVQWMAVAALLILTLLVDPDLSGCLMKRQVLFALTAGMSRDRSKLHQIGDASGD